MIAITDALREPLSDKEIVTEVRYNLRTELYHELLHVDTPSVSALRREGHKHMAFFGKNEYKQRHL